MNTDAPIVVGYDGKPDSLAALAWAATVASLGGRAIIAITIVDPRQNPHGVAWPESSWASLEDKAHQALAQWPDVSSRFERRTGHVVPRLLEAARSSSMLVVGSKGHRAIDEMFRGSVSQSAARHATVPVVVAGDSAPRPRSDRGGRRWLRVQLPRDRVRLRDG